MAESPFGAKIRKRELGKYLRLNPIGNASDAWRHIYKLLLSVDRRTRLAHVYDSNHMQRGGNFYDRAVRFTDLLCGLWGITKNDLSTEIDFMFKGCVEEYLKQRQMKAKKLEAAPEVETPEELEEVETEFKLDVRKILETELGISDPPLQRVVEAINQNAEHYFTIEKKRQNVRGEGFEDTLELLLHRVAQMPASRVLIRARASELPGMRPELASSRKQKSKIPKPDLAIVGPSNDHTLWWITAKWSLRQDRLDQFGQEWAYYQTHRMQAQQVDFVLLTNEMDIARLRDVLSPPAGGGGFHFSRVYHMNVELLRATQEARFDELELYVKDDRLFSLSDFLVHAHQLA